MNLDEPSEEKKPAALRRRRRVVKGIMIIIPLVAGIVAAWWLSRPAEPVVAGMAARSGRDAEEAEQMAARVDDLREMAAEQESAGRVEEAEETLTAAVELQREINEQFAGTAHASAERLQEIETARQTVQAMPVYATLAELDARAAGHLRRREVPQAQRAIAEAWSGMETAAVDFPLARGRDSEMRRRLEFLSGRRAEIGWIQDLAHEGLVPDPNKTGVAGLETGPGWELYKRVMGSGAGSTADERAEFCRRLGWVLGYRVRLATEATAGARSAFQVIVETGPAVTD